MISINEYTDTLINAKRYEIMNETNNIKESEKKILLNLYDEFYKFISNPYKLSGNLWSGIIADICKIINISSEKLSELVSNNIKSMKIHKFNIKDSFQNQLKQKIGNCYLIEDVAHSEFIFYSISNKKLYYVDYEHEECITFYNDFPYDSREFGDYVYGDKDISLLRSLLKEYDRKKNYNLFQ